MAKSKVKVGDILRNDWSGPNNPGKYSMVTSIGSVNIGTVQIGANGHITMGAYLRRHVDQEPEFVVVGHVDIKSIIREAIQKARDADGKADQSI